MLRMISNDIVRCSAHTTRKSLTSRTIAELNNGYNFSNEGLTRTTIGTENFEIELLLRAAPTSKVIYRMTTAERGSFKWSHKGILENEYLFPKIDDLFDQRKGAVVCLKDDLRSGHHQLRIKEFDISKMTVRTAIWALWRLGMRLEVKTRRHRWDSPV